MSTERPPHPSSARDAKLLELEAQLVEQEHRLHRVVYNFLVARKSWPKEDPRRRATISALIWRLLTPTTAVIVAGGGLFTLLGVLLAIHANMLLARQNQLIRVQTALEESSRRAALVFELSAILDQIDREVRDAEAQRSSEAKLEHSGSSTGSVRLIPLTDRTHGRVIALSRSLRPYRYLDIDVPANPLPPPHPEDQSLIDTMSGAAGALANRILAGLDPQLGDMTSAAWRLTELRSPERAQLLISLVHSGVEKRPVVEGADFSFADLHGAELMHADLHFLNLAHADLSGANLSNADLGAARLNGANLAHANLSGATLVRSELRGANLTGANLAGAHLGGARWLRQEQIDSACPDANTELGARALPAAPPDECSRWSEKLGDPFLP